jgi:hypothetical protein
MRNHETEVDPAKIGGGNTAGVAPAGHFSNLSNITNTTTMINRE